MANPHLNTGIWPKCHYDCELTGSTINFPPALDAHRYGPKIDPLHPVSAVNVSLTPAPVNLTPIVLVHSNGNVYVLAKTSQSPAQVTIFMLTKDLQPVNPSAYKQTFNIDSVGYSLIGSDGYIYMAGGKAIYKFEPAYPFNVVNTNIMPQGGLNFLNILHDGRIIAGNNIGNLYVYERDFVNHPSPIAVCIFGGQHCDNTMAVDGCNNIFLLTYTNVFALSWDGADFLCLWSYSYATSGTGSGSSPTCTDDKVIFADRPAAAPFNYVSIPRYQLKDCQAPLGVCTRVAALGAGVNPRGSDIAIVLGTDVSQGEVRRFSVSQCSQVWSCPVNNAWPTPLLTPDRVYVYFRSGTVRYIRSIYLSNGAVEADWRIDSGEDLGSFNFVVKGEESRIYVGTVSGVAIVKNT